jgi:hypothetical protein
VLYLSIIGGIENTTLRVLIAISTLSVYKQVLTVRTELQKGTAMSTAALVLGIIGGALSNRNPKVAAILQAITGLLGFIAISLFWILAGVLLLVGALMAFLSRNSSSSALKQGTQPGASSGNLEGSIT